jgi:hypothetical protein
MSDTSTQHNTENNNIEYNNINKLVKKLNDIGKETDKKEFISNYGKIKDSFEKIDTVLSLKSELNEEQSINELFKVFELNKHHLDNLETIDIHTLKNLNDLVLLIDKKLEEETMNITNIK